MPEPETYTKPPHGWTCFHCGETFTTEGAARDHFGADQMSEPGCLIAAIAPGRERGLLMALRQAEDRIAELCAENAKLTNDAYLLAGIQRDLERYFKGARTVHQAWLELDFMEGRALAAEASTNAQ